MDDQFLQFTLGAFATTILYVVITLFLAVAFDVALPTTVNWSQSEFLSDFVSMWYLFGTLLGVIDVVAFIGLVQSAFSGGGRGGF